MLHSCKFFIFGQTSLAAHRRAREKRTNVALWNISTRETDEKRLLLVATVRITAPLAAACPPVEQVAPQL